MAIAAPCEARVAAGEQCRKSAVRCRHDGHRDTAYLFCAVHDWLWRQGRVHVPDLTPEQVTALYHHIHPRSRRDGREAAVA